MMNRWLLMGGLSLLLVLLSAFPAAGPSREERTLSPAVPLPAETAPVEEAFRQDVQLWAEGQFDALWARGLLESRYQVSKEAFIRWMRQRTITPTCCWGQIRAATVHLRRPEDALVEATLGVDVKTLGTTVERTVLFHLRREEGEWRVALEDFMFKPGRCFRSGYHGCQQAIRIRRCAPQKFCPHALDVASSSGDNRQGQRVPSQRDALARGGRICLWALAFRSRLHPYRHWLPAHLRAAARPILGETSPETSIAVEPMASCRAAFLQYVLGKGRRVSQAYQLRPRPLRSVPEMDLHVGFASQENLDRQHLGLRPDMHR
jgi:hypothetical protein